MATTETRLPKKGEVADYLNKLSIVYNSAKRYALRERSSKGFYEKYKNQGEFTRHLMKKFNFLERTANSIIRLVEESYRTLEKNALYNLSRLQSKRKCLKDELDALTVKLGHYRDGARENLLTEEELETFRTLKNRHYWKKTDFDRVNSEIRKLKKQIETGHYTMVQGGKDFFNKRNHLERSGYQSHEKWLKDFREKRDANIEYLGRNSERQGNQICQLRTTDRYGYFDLQLRKEKDFCKSTNRKDKYIVVKNLKFSYLTDELTEQLEAAQDKNRKTKSLFIRFHKRGRKGWYLQVTLELEEPPVRTSIENGTVGVDLNSGFLEAVEVDSTGNFMEKRHYPFKYHAKGNKGLDEVRKTAKEISLWANNQGKSLVIEDLSFDKKKRHLRKGKTGKKLNRDIHSLDYKRIREALERAAFRTGTGLVTVNPAYSSKIGKEKYLQREEFKTVHECAAFVIARRGMGIKEDLYGF